MLASHGFHRPTVAALELGLTAVRGCRREQAELLDLAKRKRIRALVESDPLEQVNEGTTAFARNRCGCGGAEAS